MGSIVDRIRKEKLERQLTRDAVLKGLGKSEAQAQDQQKLLQGLVQDVAPTLAQGVASEMRQGLEKVQQGLVGCLSREISKLGGLPPSSSHPPPSALDPVLPDPEQADTELDFDDRELALRLESVFGEGGGEGGTGSQEAASAEALAEPLPEHAAASGSLEPLSTVPAYTHPDLSGDEPAGTATPEPEPPATSLPDLPEASAATSPAEEPPRDSLEPAPAPGSGPALPEAASARPEPGESPSPDHSGMASPASDAPADRAEAGQTGPAGPYSTALLEELRSMLLPGIAEGVSGVLEEIERTQVHLAREMAALAKGLASLEERLGVQGAECSEAPTETFPPRQEVLPAPEAPTETLSPSPRQAVSPFWVRPWPPGPCLPPAEAPTETLSPEQAVFPTEAPTETLSPEQAVFPTEAPTEALSPEQAVFPTEAPTETLSPEQAVFHTEAPTETLPFGQAVQPAPEVFRVPPDAFSPPPGHRERPLPAAAPVAAGKERHRAGQPPPAAPALTGPATLEGVLAAVLQALREMEGRLVLHLGSVADENLGADESPGESEETAARGRRPF